MNEHWFRQYVLLAFRMDKAMRKFTESRFVDYYYGPPEWKAGLSDEEALRFLEFLKVPFQQAYIFTYFHGKQLMKPWLQGPDRWNAFRLFLTEQVYPSELLNQ